MATTQYQVDGLDFGRDWQGQWIDLPGLPETNAYAHFRRVFTAPADTAGWQLLVSADTRCRVWVNGQMFPIGPPQSQSYYKFYDQLDLAPHLRAGENCIAILVHYTGDRGKTRPALIAEIVDSAGQTVLGTDADWAALVGRAWRVDTYRFRMNVAGPYQEHCRLADLPLGWLDADYDDSAWPRARVIGPAPTAGPWCRLVPRDIPLMAERPLYAQDLQVEECIDLEARTRNEDLSISLSQAGRPLDWASATNPRALLTADGADGVASVQCSTRHQDHVTDGRYDPCILLDFGEVITAYAVLDLECQAAGATVEIGYAERLVDGHFNIAIEGTFADCFTLVPGRHRLQPYMWRSFRYMRLRFKRAESPVTIHAAHALESTYPYQERGHFESADSRLEDVFAICRRGIRLCSNESLMDTPQREQAQWLGDVAAVTLGGIYACFGDSAMPAKFLRQSGMNQMNAGVLSNLSNTDSHGNGSDIADYSLWWLIGMRDHHLYSGDARLIQHHWPAVIRVMQAHLARIDRHGVLQQMPGWVFIDWAAVDKTGACAANNAMLIGALDAIADMAEVRGDAYVCEQAEDAAERLRAAFAATFYDAERGVVIDAVRPDGARSERVSEQANAAAIYFDCLPDDSQRDSIVQHLWVDHDTPAVEAQPFFCFFVLRALHAAGRADLALDMIRERWGERMVDRGLASCTEEWGMNGSWRRGETYWGFMRTLSHAWGAGPAQYLIHDLIGLDIREPGCSEIAIAPYRADVAYNVICPLPSGDLHIAWDGEHLTIDAPPGVTVKAE